MENKSIKIFDEKINNFINSLNQKRNIHAQRLLIKNNPIPYRKNQKKEFQNQCNELKIDIINSTQISEKQKNEYLSKLELHAISHLKWIEENDIDGDKFLSTLIRNISDAELARTKALAEKSLRRRKTIERLVAPRSHVEIEFTPLNSLHRKTHNKIIVKSNLYETYYDGKYYYVKSEGVSYDNAVVNLYKKLFELKKAKKLRKIDRNADGEGV